MQVDSGRTLSAANAGTPQPNWDDILAEEPGWAWLRAACGIPDLGLDAVLIALAPELDPRYEKVFAFLQQDPSQRQPTVHLVLSLLSTTLSDKITNRRLFDADGSLLDQRIIRLVPNPRGGTSLMSQIVTVDAQIVDVVLGLGAWTVSSVGSPGCPDRGPHATGLSCLRRWQHCRPSVAM